MLLPSALPCDSRGASSFPPAHRFRSQALFASPPTSPPQQSSSNPSSTIFATCRALQSMLSTPSQLPTPPSSHADLPANFKLRLRNRKTGDSTSEVECSSVPTARRRIAKRAPPPRGVNKRRRVVEDVDGDNDSGVEDDASDHNLAPSAETAGPSTPKRMRLAPEILPLGLEHSDFRKLASGPNGKVEGLRDEDENTMRELEGLDWSNEEDRLLVELVLEKLKLTKSDWQDCARSLGKDRASVGRRWKSLMGGGEVGLKSRNKRSKLHGTWR